MLETYFQLGPDSDRLSRGVQSGKCKQETARQKGFGATSQEFDLLTQILPGERLQSIGGGLFCVRGIWLPGVLNVGATHFHEFNQWPGDSL